MNHFKEKRNCKRSTSVICKVFVSDDRILWEEVDLKDISACGLQFMSNNRYAINDLLYINLHVYNFSSEFCMMIEGHITRVNQNNVPLIYGFQFSNLEKYTRVQLDELINSRITVKK